MIVLLLVLAALAAPLPSAYDPNLVDLSSTAQPPSAAHLLGTDELGRDELTRILYGGRITLLTGVVALIVALGIGLPAGLVAGYRGGLIDLGLMRLMDLMLAFPGLLLAILVVTILGPTAESAMVAVGVASIPSFALLVRAATLSLREMAYVEAARVTGLSWSGILWRHILPNTLPVVVVQSTLRMGTAILTAAGLGFLGLGAQPPAAEWGLMLNQGRAYLQMAPHIVVFPSLAILLAVIALNLAGDALNDALNPRLRGHP